MTNSPGPAPACRSPHVPSFAAGAVYKFQQRHALREWLTQKRTELRNPDAPSRHSVTLTPRPQSPKFRTAATGRPPPVLTCSRQRCRPRNSCWANTPSSPWPRRATVSLPAAPTSRSRWGVCVCVCLRACTYARACTCRNAVERITVVLRATVFCCLCSACLWWPWLPPACACTLNNIGLPAQSAAGLRPFQPLRPPPGFRTAASCVSPPF